MTDTQEWYYEDCSGEKHTDPDGNYLDASHPCVVCDQKTHRYDMTYNVMLHEDGCLPEYEAYVTRLRKEFKEMIERRREVSDEWTSN